MPDRQSYPSGRPQGDWANEVLGKLDRLGFQYDSLQREIEKRFTDQSRTSAETKEELCKKLDTVNVILTGNGDPSKGLVVRMTMLEANVGDVEEKVEKDADRRTWAFRMVVGAGFTAVLSLIVAVGKFFVK